MKRISILGSTGSIGRNTLEVLRYFPDRFKIVGLAACSNVEVLRQQIKDFHPQMVAVTDVLKVQELNDKLLRDKVRIFYGEEGLEKLIQKKVDLLVMAISGSAALMPLWQAIEYQPTIALANKEALIMAGPLIMKKIKRFKRKIIPIDSEQSAIWQCLDGKDRSYLKKIYLTASGGPLRNLSKKELSRISVKKVLNHPRWEMGKKITVDSATLMNKGLELLETMYLFDVDYSCIEILIHPQAIIHSMVEFIDGSILAQLSLTDMRIPIQYALTYPKRFCGFLPALDFFKVKNLSFYKPDLDKFPCLELAYEAARRRGTLPAVLNAANEVAVEAFLNEKIKFHYIFRIIEKVICRHKNVAFPVLEDILMAHDWAKLEAQRLVKKWGVN